MRVLRSVVRTPHHGAHPSATRAQEDHGPVLRPRAATCDRPAPARNSGTEAHVDEAVSADLGRVVDAVADALRFALVEGDAREDLSPAERQVLLCLVADSAEQLDTWLEDRARHVPSVPAGTGPAARPLLARLAPHLAATTRGPAPPRHDPDDPAAVVEAARRGAEAVVRRTVRRLLLPARAGVAVGLLAAGLLWTLEFAALRNQGTVVLLVAGIGVLALGLLAATAFSPGFVSELGSTTGAVLTRAGSVGRHVERLYADRTARALSALTALGAPAPRPTTLLRLRAAARSAAARVYTAALLVGLALFLGMTRVLGLL